MDRAENFKKVLEVMFDGSPPQVGSSDSIFDTGYDSDSSTTTSAGSLWYPDYNSNYALGKCVNEVPVPSGRPNYDSGEACCQAAYGSQSSGLCLSSLSGVQSTPSSTIVTSTSTEATPAFTSTTSATLTSMMTSSSTSPQDTSTQIATTQASTTTTVATTTDATLPQVTTTESSISSRWYPDYNNDYALGKCSNELPIPSGRPNYDSGLECCQAAYGQQASGVCKNMFSNAVSSSTSLIDRWYPDYHNNYALGKCNNEVPIPSGRPNYDTGFECCQKAYGSQSSGVCLGSLPDLSTVLRAEPGITTMEAYARSGNTFITYNCGEDGADIPMNSLVVDIIYDYEVSTPSLIQAEHMLPGLKKQTLEDIAHDLGCEAYSRRNLRRANENQVLLGFHAAQGSDVIDGQKGMCFHFILIVLNYSSIF